MLRNTGTVRMSCRSVVAVSAPAGSLDPAALVQRKSRRRSVSAVQNRSTTASESALSPLLWLTKSNGWWPGRVAAAVDTFISRGAAAAFDSDTDAAVSERACMSILSNCRTPVRSYFCSPRPVSLLADLLEQLWSQLYGRDSSREAFPLAMISPPLAKRAPQAGPNCLMPAAFRPAAEERRALRDQP